MAKVITGPRPGTLIWHNGAFIRVGDKLSVEHVKSVAAAGFKVREMPDDMAPDAPVIAPPFIPDTKSVETPVPGIDGK
jgi:hypothetical protein